MGVFFVCFLQCAAEFAILSLSAAATAVKFALHIVDSNMAGAWHGKTMWIMLLEFFSEVGFGDEHQNPAPLPPCR